MPGFNVKKDNGKYQAVVMSGNNKPFREGIIQLELMRDSNFKHLLEEAKDVALYLQIEEPRIEINEFGKDGLSETIAEYEYFTSVKNTTGWFDMNGNYPERKRPGVLPKPSIFIKSKMGYSHVPVTYAQAVSLVGSKLFRNYLRSTPPFYNGELHCFESGAKLCVNKMHIIEEKIVPAKYWIKGYSYDGRDVKALGIEVSP